MSWPEGVAARRIPAPDGTRSRVFTSGTGPPLVLVHGTAGDHTTFRVVGPMLATRRTVHAIDRRGRGASGDAAAYAIEREYDDLAAVAQAIAAETGGGVEVVGHSYGGRCALGAALRTDAIARVVCYEGAPPPAGVSYQPAGLEAELRGLLDAGETDELYATFLTRVVGMPPAELAAYRDDPSGRSGRRRPRRSSASSRRSGPRRRVSTRSGAVRQPVLQILGGESLPVFARATAALDDRLADGRVAVIAGARHAAHHTHPAAFVWWAAWRAPGMTAIWPSASRWWSAAVAWATPGRLSPPRICRTGWRTAAEGIEAGRRRPLGLEFAQDGRRRRPHGGARPGPRGTPRGPPAASRRPGSGRRRSARSVSPAARRPRSSPPARRAGSSTPGGVGAPS